MVVLTIKMIEHLEDKYYWYGYRKGIPFSADLKATLLEIYGTEPYPREWSDNDLYTGTRKMIEQYLTEQDL